LAFGADLGPVLAAVAVTNFPVVTLDLSGVDGAEQVTVSAAGNYTPNALYISNLLGVTPANAATVLDSSINVYYDDGLNLALSSLTFPLDSGGFLLPFNKVPKGSTFMIR
jgi:hypothetical protein